MNTIWKYQLKVTGEQVIKTPVGAKFLTVQTQYGVPCIWYEVNSEEERKEDHYFRIYGTGHPQNKIFGMEVYKGTFQIEGGQLVFHLFEVI